jgi:hypothetical protein
MTALATTSTTITVSSAASTVVLNAQDANGVKWIVRGFDGWGGVAPTIQVVQKPRQQGGWAGLSYGQPRYLALSLMVVAPTPAALNVALDALYAAVDFGSCTLTVAEAAFTRSLTVRRNSDIQSSRTSNTIANVQFQVVAVDPRKLGAAVTQQTALPSTVGGLVFGTTNYAWLGTANASASTETTPLGVVRTNLCANPVPASTTGYSGAATGTVSTMSDGTPCFQVVTSTSTTPYAFSAKSVSGATSGVTYVLSAKVEILGDTTGATYSVRGHGTTGNVYFTSGSQTITTNGSGAVPAQRISLVVTPNANVAAGEFDFTVVRSGTAASGVTIRLGNVLIEQATSFVSYFDGGTASWGGLTIPFTIPSTVVAGQINLTNPGNESGPVVLRIDGPCTGPIITHTSSTTTNALVFSSNLSLGTGEFLLVDMDKHTALANGQTTRAGYITSRGWSLFDPGANTWAFTASTYNSGSLLTVTASPAWK